MSSIVADPHVVVDDDAPGPPISVPDSGEGEGGKLKMIVQLVKKSLGVKDIAAMRLSLPASLLEPIPNLEYWHYLDRPDMFAAINDSDDPFERMLAIVRFTFTKDLKFHGKVCKPYNSVLGEHFRAHWDVVPAKAPTSQSGGLPVSTSMETASVKSGHSSKSTRSGVSSFSKTGKSPSTAATSLEAPNAEMSQLNLAHVAPSDENIRVIYITEQVSHHPPVSAYYAACPSRSLELYGIDQISAKISGTTLRVAPGSLNKGIFINITGGPGAGEHYNITHPIASVNGLLRGSFYVTVAESTIISCTGGNQRFRAVIEYKEESWLGRAHFLSEGVIHTVVEGETQHNEWTKVKHVPQARVVAVFDGSWRNRIRWRRVGVNSYPDATPSSYSSPSPSHTSLPIPVIPSAASSRLDISAAKEEEYATLLDLSTLEVLPKTVRPIEKQLPHESRRLWDSVTTRLLKKEFSDATKEKVAIEQRQRDVAADRKRKGVEFVPCYFEKNLDAGYAALTPAGRQAVEEELQEPSQYDIEDSPATLTPPAA
ncbi:hypothetical protein FB451DRAFT_1232295 [Mycena latifolia]|nr:hypothetical protein FB451DRAFT_1232295 [Mycena latifolia]